MEVVNPVEEQEEREEVSQPPPVSKRKLDGTQVTPVQSIIGQHDQNCR